MGLYEDRNEHDKQWFSDHQAADEQLAAGNAAQIDRLTQEVREAGDDLATAGAALTASRAETARVQADLNAARVQLRDADYALAALQAKYDAYVASHPDAKKTTLIGSSASRIAGESSNAQALTRLESKLGPIQVARVYDENVGGPRALSRARESGLGARAISVSFKYAPSSVIAGQQDAAIKTLATALKAEKGNFPVYLTYEHEADAKVQKGGYTAAQFRDAWTRVYDLVKAIDSTINMTLILTGYQFNQRIANFYVPGKVDVVGVDPYSYSAADDASVLITNFGMLDWFNSNKVRWAVTEVGQHADDIASHVALVKSYSEFIDLGAEFVCHFNAVVNNDVTGIPDDFRIDDKTQTAEAFRNLKRG